MIFMDGSRLFLAKVLPTTSTKMLLQMAIHEFLETDL